MASIGDWYAWWTLDCVVEAAHAVAGDFVNRPGRYQDVVETTTLDALKNFWFRSGVDANWPNEPQRAKLYSVILGASVGKPGLDRRSEFHRGLGPLRRAAVANAKAKGAAGDTTFEQIRGECQRFRDCLKQSGATKLVDAFSAGLSAAFDRARDVFKDNEIRKAFGVDAAPIADWPVPPDQPPNDAYNLDRARLIEEVIRVLKPSNSRALTQRQFLKLQEAAYWGKKTIDEVMSEADWHDPKIGGKVREIAEYTYYWDRAVRQLDASNDASTSSCGTCTYEWWYGTWMLIEDNCTSGCTCQSPGGGGKEGDFKKTMCA